MATKSTDSLAILVQPYDEHGTTKIRASVCTVQPNGELHGVLWSGGFDPGSAYDGFTIGAYIGTPSGLPISECERGVWGLGFAYRPHRIDSVGQANAIARVMGKVQRGLWKLTESEGCHPDSDYATYVLRIARILRITRIYVQNSHKAASVSGDMHRSVNGAGLQTWVASYASAVEQGRKHEYVGRGR